MEPATCKPLENAASAADNGRQACVSAPPAVAESETDVSITGFGNFPDPKPCEIRNACLPIQALSRRRGRLI